jgi:hypothetical protein
MKWVHLDFVADPPSVRTWRWLLLVLGLTTLVAVGSYLQFDLMPRTEEIQSELARQTALAAPPGPRPTSLKPAELLAAWRKAQAVSDQINLPWTRLFTAIAASSDNENLAFLAVEPDTIKGQIVILAEARDFDGMLKFYRAMQANEDFSDVALQSHVINQAVAEKPVRFRLSARWKVKG